MEKEDGFYYIEVRSPREYKRFRVQKVDDINGIERVGGQLDNGSWETIKWLVSKDLAHVENGRLIADQEDVKKLFKELVFVPKQISGDYFAAKD